MMNKIYIVGIVASGKTTFAKKLSSRTAIPWYELDSIVYTGTGMERTKQSANEQCQRIHQINGTGSWIVEGVYRKSCHILLDLADQIVFLDTPLYKRRFRTFCRFIKQKLKLEPCGYQPDLKMLSLMYRWTSDFERNKADFMEMLHLYHEKLVVISDPSDYKILL